MLPTSRNNTYVNGTSEVDANDLNDIQDRIIDLYGERTVGVLAAAFPAQSGAHESNGRYWESAGAAQVHPMQLPLREGDRIKLIVATVEQVSGADMNLVLHIHHNDGSTSGIWSAVFSVAAGVQQYTFDGADHVLGAGEVAVCRFLGNTGDRVYKLAATYDRPA